MSRWKVKREVEECSLERYDAAEPWLRRALPFLEANETEYGLQWRLARRIVSGSSSYASVLAFCWTSGGEVCGIGLQTLPYHKMIVSMKCARDVEMVAQRLIPLASEASCVQGPRSWLERLKSTLDTQSTPSHFGTGQWLYRLDTVVRPTAPIGELVLAPQEGFDDFLRSAAAGFSSETQIRATAEEIWTRVQRYRADRRLYLLIDGYDPVSCAVLNDHGPHSRSIGFVYTPPERRGRGYASSLVTSLSQRVLDEGAKFCTLYTESSNPTSNKIYQNIGYRLVAKHDELWLKLEDEAECGT